MSLSLKKEKFRDNSINDLSIKTEFNIFEKTFRYYGSHFQHIKIHVSITLNTNCLPKTL